MNLTFSIHWKYGAGTHTGWFRTLNEDRSLLRMGTSPSGVPYAAAVMADGMGGTGDGGLASELAVEKLKTWMEQKLPTVLDDSKWMSRLEIEGTALLHNLHRHLVDKRRAHGQTLGTTLTLLVLFQSVYNIFHIGDCRIYKFYSSGRLAQLTRDHSWVAEQVRKGFLAKHKARTHPKRHILTQGLGLGKEPKVYVRSGTYHPGTLFLLTSDGFHDRFSNEAIAIMLRRASSSLEPQDVCDQLITRALDKHADDNISLLLIKPIGRNKTLRALLGIRTKLCWLWIRRLLRRS
ncbi:PP2C family protein-serine/threonine phosphatase [Paenibacillus cremeus]|uniref:Serine/threonine-protein phosphatase n=1 Tax=Paenibacillus cremeus TaxID=2163881 RepID=A0A559KDD6_9BACL|nr:PP2C family serine/threonine-protein phosphatase [Paenibacillus cremeus]TVY10114.1 serine/threonine-protein phosphatase [Paenibacillus cremeus]